MKKSFYKISLVLAFTIVMVSCKRNQCHECHYDDTTGNEVALGEKCGDELENLEANGYTDSKGTYVVHCHGH